MKDYDKNKDSSYVKYWNVSNLWAMLQKLPVNKFEWIEENSQLNHGFIKNYNELKLIFNTQKNYMNIIMTYHFYQKERKIKKEKTLLLIYMIKMNMSFT